MKISTEGQVTIPQDIRDQLGLLPDTEVEFEIVDDWVRVRRASSGGPGRRIVDALRGRATAGLSTDEILAMTRPPEGE